jgi:hypothetical protein
MEELVAYDPQLIVGILGGGAGTTYDAFKMLGEAKKYGARAALYGRKINNAENQLAFVEFLRLIAEAQISPEEAVKAYHGVLQKLKIKPQRSLADDMQLTNASMSYGGGSQASVPAGLPKPASTAAKSDCGCGGPSPEKCACKGHPHSVPKFDPKALPDFSTMSAADKLAWNRAKRDHVFGV